MFRRRVKHVSNGSGIAPYFRKKVVSTETVETPFALLGDEMIDWVMFVHITTVGQSRALGLLSIGTDNQNCFRIVQFSYDIDVYAVTNNLWSYYDANNNIWANTSNGGNPQTNLNIAIKRDGNSLYASNDGINWTEAIVCPSASAGLILNFYPRTIDITMDVAFWLDKDVDVCRFFTMYNNE